MDESRCERISSTGCINGVHGEPFGPFDRSIANRDRPSGPEFDHYQRTKLVQTTGRGMNRTAVPVPVTPISSSRTPAIMVHMNRPSTP